MLTNNEQFNTYSFIRFRNMLAKGVEKFGYTSISRKSGIARSTLYRIIQGDITDVKLSTAQLIQTTIMALKKKST